MERSGMELGGFGQMEVKQHFIAGLFQLLILPVSHVSLMKKVEIIHLHVPQKNLHSVKPKHLVSLQQNLQSSFYFPNSV